MKLERASAASRASKQDAQASHESAIRRFTSPPPSSSNATSQLAALDIGLGSNTVATKYHRAALDGYVDMLCDASKRDSNLAAPKAGLTPTLLAAQSGHLEALRMLVGRGGDPERTGCDGSSGLHLAAARNHLNCVSFLVNFGVNMWALDNELHTAKDVAAMCQAKEVLDYLDQMMAKQSALNTKTVQRLKEKAKSAAEKRIKQARKLQLKAIKQAERDERFLVRLSNNRRLLKAAHSISDIELVGRTSQASQASRNGLQADLMRSLQQQQHKLLDSGQPKRGLGSPTGLSQPSTSSAYSSISAASSILSSLASEPRATDDKRRPRYSDLVALEPSRGLLGADRKAATESPPSTIASRLRGLGSGVSRKVQLRRLLQAASGALAPTSGGAPDSGPASSGAQSPGRERLGGKLGAPRLRWPLALPGATLSRATSEPDFGAALRSHPQHSDMDGERMRRVAVPRTDHSKGHEQDTALLSRSANSAELAEGAKRAQTDSAAKLSASGPTTSGASSSAEESRSSEPVQQLQQPPPPRLAGQQQPPADSAHHQLLTQCLSQIKLRHEAIALRASGAAAAEAPPVAAGSKPLAGARPSAASGRAAFGAHSDELLQHQLNAGDAPLRPSLIRQQLRHAAAAAAASCSTAPKLHKETSESSAPPPAAHPMGPLEVRPPPPPPQRKPAAPGLVQAHGRPAYAKSSQSSSPGSSLSFGSSSRTSYGGCSSSDEPETGADSGSLSAAKTAPPEAGSSGAKRAAQPGSMQSFLEANKLAELATVFDRERIDLEALSLLTEDDLKSLHILLGPRRKLLRAIQEMEAQRRVLKATGRRFLMVDAQL